MPPCRGSAALKAPCVSVCEPRYIYLSKITHVCTVLTWSHQSQIAWILSFVYIKRLTKEKSTLKLSFPHRIRKIYRKNLENKTKLMGLRLLLGLVFGQLIREQGVEI